MLLRPTSPVSVFLIVRVGAYCIRPIRRPRKGDECGCPIILQGNLLEASGPCRARSWGVCNTPLPCRSIVFIQMGRAQQHTLHQISPTRGRMRFLGYVDRAFVGGIRALSCPFVGRMQYAPTLTVDCIGSFCQSSDLDAPSGVPDKGTEVGVGFGCRVRFWDCGGGGGDVTGPYFGLPRGVDCQYGRYFELLRGID